MADREFLERLSRELVDQGHLIEAGWVGLRLAIYPTEQPGKEQLEDMHRCFFAGALHLFSSIMAIMDADHEPTDADMRRMALIADELETFGDSLEREIGPKGRTQ
jgi:hypothetical protein